MKILPFLICLFATTIANAQFNIPEPIINEGTYLITDTIFMAPDGNDAAPGTFAQPVKSFNVAVQKLPFGTAGINGGNAYNLIILKEGFYRTSSGFHQSTSQWKNGNTYKNISIEGSGNVIIGGTKDSFATEHLLILRGDNIFIKNINLKYSKGIGLLLNRADLTTPRQRNVLINGVKVDSVGSFSMLLRNVDTIMVKNSSSFYSSRPGNDQLVSPCQWPSGIKFFNSKNIIIHNSEIAYSRGEGLNFHNSQLGKAYNNIIHDNSLNFYNDNSAKLQVHNNLIYNTPGISTKYWRSCPGDTNPVWASGGMLIANEGACDKGNSPVFENCQTKCILPTEYFPNVDSMFVYNNIFQNTGEAISFWQGSTNIVGANCIKNVFISHNTFIGTMGMAGVTSNGFIRFFFPNYNVLLNSFYGYLQNIHITNNIFTYDSLAYPNMDPVRKEFHVLHPGPNDITFGGNLWVKNSNHLGSTDIVRNNLPAETYLLTDSLNSILPCPDNSAFVSSSTGTAAYITDDYSHKPRNPNSNAGALEYNTICGILNNIEEPTLSQLTVFPNPCNKCGKLTLNLPIADDFQYRLISVTGKLIVAGKVFNAQIESGNPPAGIYILELSGKDRKFVKKIIFN